MGQIPVVNSAWICSDLNIKADKCMASAFDKHVTRNSDLHCPNSLSLSESFYNNRNPQKTWE